MRSSVALVVVAALCAVLTIFSALQSQQGVSLELQARARLLETRRRQEARWIGHRLTQAATAGTPEGGAATIAPLPRTTAAQLEPIVPETEVVASSAVREKTPSAVGAGLDASLVDRSDAAALAAGCTLPRRPYHMILTSSSGNYQAWQSRIAYHHFRLQRARDPCGEMGAFTRLLTSRNAAPDGLMDEMPTIVVSELTEGYPVVNRPHSMLEFVGNAELFGRTVKDECAAQPNP